MANIFEVPQPGKDLLEKANKVRSASIEISQTENQKRIKALNFMADYLEKNSNEILDANNSDYSSAQKKGISRALLSRLKLSKSKLDLVVAGTKDAVLMVESEASGLTEEEMLNAVKFGHEGFVPVIEMIEELAKECRKPEWTVEKKDLSEVKKKLEETFTDDLKKAFATRDKQDRSNQISEITDKAKKLYEEDENYTDLDVILSLKKLKNL